MGEYIDRCMTLGSLFDGSGTCCLAAEMCGIKPLWSSEIEPFPRKVTESRFPHVKHYGDITKLSGYELEPVDIISFGSPCQNLSVAGLREGLHGDRSNLFFEATRIIKEMREATNNQYPRFAMWENVLGSFSSKKGEDFRYVIQEFIKVATGNDVTIPRPKKWEHAGYVLEDDYSIAWRVLDAQYWGVPQRRRRVYLVADFTGQRAGEILFKRPGLSRDPAPGGKSRERVTSGAKRCTGETGGVSGELEPFTCGNGQGDIVGHISKNIAGTLDTMHDQQIVCHPETESKSDGVMCVATQQANAEIMVDMAPTVTSAAGTSGNNQPYVLLNEKSRAGIKNLNKGDIQSKQVLDPSGIAPTLYSGECRYGGGEMYVLDKEVPPHLR